MGSGSNGHTPGDKCQFPFVYFLSTRRSCITNGNGGVHWCYTVPNGGSGDPWANCDMDSCRYGTNWKSSLPKFSQIYSKIKSRDAMITPLNSFYVESKSKIPFHANKNTGAATEIVKVKLEQFQGF